MSKKTNETTLSKDLLAGLALAQTHALKLRILEAVVDGRASSPLELSRALDEKLGNVSYHVKALAKADVLTLVKTEPRRGSRRALLRDLQGGGRVTKAGGIA